MDFNRENAKWLKSFLDSSDYWFASMLPSRKSTNPVYLLFDLFNLADFVRGKSVVANFSYAQQFFVKLLYFKSKKAALLGSLFVCGTPAQLEPLFSRSEVEKLEEIGLVELKGRQAIPKFRITPFGELYLVSDLDRQTEDFVYIGHDSFNLAELLPKLRSKMRYRRSVDVGTATGIQAFSISPFSDKVEGFDINKKALVYAKFNSTLNSIENVSFRESDLLSSAEGEYDLIVSNPPFVFMPEKDKYGHVHGYGGGKYGLELTMELIAQAKKLLSKDGEIYIIATSPVVHGQDIFVKLLNEELGEEFSAEALQQRYSLYKEFYQFHKESGISKFILYVMKIKRSAGKSVKVIPLPLHKKIFNELYIFFSKLVLR